MESRKEDVSVGADGTEQPPLSSLVGLERKCKISLQMVHYRHLISKDRERREAEKIRKLDFI